LNFFHELNLRRLLKSFYSCKINKSGELGKFEVKLNELDFFLFGEGLREVGNT